MVSRTSRDSNIAANTDERKAEEDGEENSRVHDGGGMMESGRCCAATYKQKPGPRRHP